MDSDEPVGKFLRETKFLRLFLEKTPPIVSGLRIEPAEPIWVSKILAYHLFRNKRGERTRDFFEMPLHTIDHFHLTEIYDTGHSIDPMIMERIGVDKLHYYMAENPQELLEIIKGRDVESVSKEGVDDKGIKITADNNTALKGGIRHVLTPNQLEVVVTLEKASNRDDPWMKWETIKQMTGISANKMYDVFRRNAEAKEALVQRDPKSRLYRLNI